MPDALGIPVELLGGVPEERDEAQQDMRCEQVRGRSKQRRGTSD